MATILRPFKNVSVIPATFLNYHITRVNPIYISNIFFMPSYNECMNFVFNLHVIYMKLSTHFPIYSSLKIKQYYLYVLFG